MDFRQELQTMVDEVPGALGGILVAQDGMLVETCVAEGLDDGLIEELGAEFSALLAQVARIVETTRLGALSDFSITTDAYQVTLVPCGTEYFLIMLLKPDGIAGKGRFLMTQFRPRLAEEL